jgi:hypothetical protein
MEEKTNMTAERSLEIIRESIERSQRVISKNSGLPLVWWGACVVVFALLIDYLWKNHGGPVWNVLWFVMWVVGYIGNRVIDKKKETVPTTFVGKTIGHVWATFGIFCGGIGLVLCLIGCGIIPMKCVVPVSEQLVYMNLTSIICLCFGIASTITGFVLENRPIQICGLIAGFGGFFAALHFPMQQMYVMAAVALIGLIIPGLLIHFQNQK